VLLLTGQQSIFNNTTKALHLAIIKAVADRTKVEFVEVASVANVLEEKVRYFHRYFIRCFRYFYSPTSCGRSLHGQKCVGAAPHGLFVATPVISPQHIYVDKKYWNVLPY